jgi:DNA mismatch repair protein MutL
MERSTELTPHEIHILPEHIANQIAAGEVVQRPESVIKELVENSLDAGASTIAVVVRGAGKQLLHVIDNGRGMSKTDLPLALKRHATSKIKTAQDLHRIQTLGFRGEALASIASVAHVEIRSRRAASGETNTDVGSDIGWKLVSEPLQEPSIEPCAMDTGTQVFVRNLFFNVPARRKFLRSDLTEFRHIADTMLRFALGNPQRRFVLYDDDALIYDLAPATLHGRMTDALSAKFADALVPLEFRDIINGTSIEITGFVGQPRFAKKTRSEQFLYLNGRAITSRQLNHAVISAYEHLIDHASYPPFVLFLTMDVERVDVNVHPQKHEVKFDDDRSIYNAMRRAVAEALRGQNFAPQAEFHTAELRSTAESPFEKFRLSPNSSPNSSPNATPDARHDEVLVNRLTGEILDTNVSRGNTYQPTPERRITGREFDGFTSMFGKESLSHHTSQISAPAYGIHTGSDDNADTLFTDASHSARTPQAAQHLHTASTPQRYLWQLHKKYIMMQTQRGLVMIDQHAAHERILYERALRAMNEGFAYGQELLFPARVALTPAEAALVQELEEDVRQMGFQISLDAESGSSMNTVIAEIHSVPADVRNGHEESVLKELLDQYREYSTLRHTSARDNLAASYGCRSAIRAGDALTVEEMRQLVDDLYASSTPYACPHGRPIIIEFALDEFDRRFGRTS